MKTMSFWNTSSSASHLSSIIHNICSTYNAYSVHNTNFISWILDPWATDHVISDVNLLHNFWPWHSILYLSNGDIVLVACIDDVYLNSTLLLFEVLCVPSFHCCLISISKQIADSSISVIFSKNNCLYDLSVSVPHHRLTINQCARVHYEPSVEAQV